MKKFQIKRKIKRESDFDTPDVFDKVLSESQNQGFSASSSKTKKRFPVYMRVCAAAVSLALCLAVVLPFVLKKNNTPSVYDYTTVCMQINPSVELKVENGKVTQVKALNKDAVLLLLNINLIGMNADEAGLLVANTAQKSSFLTQNGIGLYVAGNDEEEVKNSISQALENANFKVNSFVDQSTFEQAKKYGVSAGTMSLINEILKISPAWTLESLLKKSPEDLCEILEDYDENEIGDFETLILNEYKTEYAQFVEKVKELLGQYKGDVESLKQFVSQDGFSVAQLNEKIKEFNDKYSVLDDDLYIEYFDENDGISADDFNEYLEEIDELLKDIEEDADEEFADMFEDWLESFKSHHRDDDDD